MVLFILRINKIKLHSLLFITSFTLLTACAETGVLTKKEMVIQNKADTVVSNVYLIMI